MIDIDDSDINHSYDKSFKFKTNEEIQDKYWTDVTDPHFMVWYQTESLSDFIKLYGRINTTLYPDIEYTLELYDNFDAPSIGSNKYIKLSEVGSFGGKNMVLPYMFLGMAVLILAILIMFMVCYFAKIHGKDRDSEKYLESLTY